MSKLGNYVLGFPDLVRLRRGTKGMYNYLNRLSLFLIWVCTSEFYNLLIEVSYVLTFCIPVVILIFSLINSSAVVCDKHTIYGLSLCKMDVSVSKLPRVCGAIYVYNALFSPSFLTRPFFPIPPPHALVAFRI